MNIRHSDVAIRCSPEYRAPSGYHPLRESSLYDDYRRRVVVPLVRKALLGPIADSGFNPTFTLEDLDVVLHPLEIVSIPVGQLGTRVGSLSDAGDRIIQAIDPLLSRAWR